MSNIWKSFDKLSGDCYMEMVSERPALEPWLEAFSSFKNALDAFTEEKNENSAYQKYRTLESLEEDTEWDHDFSGWLMDFLDELNMLQDYKGMLSAINYLRKKFVWNNDENFDMDGREVDALLKTNQFQKADKKSAKWVASDPENPAAVSGRIYCCMKTGNLEEAKRFIDEWIPGGCNDESYVIFAIAEKYYEAIGDSENQKKLKEEMEAFNNRQMKAMMSGLGEDYWSGINDEELPFR